MTKKKTENNGRLIVKARDGFFEKHGIVLLAGSASGEYLKNRLEVAFIAGYDAATKNRRAK